MFRNKFEISKIIGFILLGPCLFVGSILLHEISRNSDYFKWGLYHTVTLVSLTLGIISAIGLILKLNWVRYLVAAVFVGLGILWVLFFITEVGFDDRELKIFVGFTAFAFITITGISLLLFNEKVEEEFGLKYEEEENDILDFN